MTLRAIIVASVVIASGSALHAGNLTDTLLSRPNASSPPPVDKFVLAGYDKVADEYLIGLPDGVSVGEVSAFATQLANTYGVTVVKEWSDAVKAIFVRATASQAAAIALLSQVTYVEENAQWHVSSQQQTNINPATCDPTAGSCPSVVDDRLWHLDRSDQNYAPPTNSYSYCTDGTGITVYVVDTGVNKFHNEFGPSGARVKTGFNSSGDLMPANDPCLGFVIPPAGTYDYLENQPAFLELYTASHGTAVAAALGGRRVGVAKNVTIIPIKTSRCDWYSARARLSAHFYQQNETMFRSPSGGNIDEIYRAQNSGVTAGTEPSTWNTVAGQVTADGQVNWEFVPSSVWRSPQTTQMVIDGLNWILSASNTQGPKANAIVTMSTFRVASSPGVAGPSGTLESAIRTLLASNITVIASANNQNGNACDTSPARLSINNPDTAIANNVITAGGSMILNRPWNVDITDVGGSPADGNGKGFEPAFNTTQPVRDARWICGRGDSAQCLNSTPTETISPTAGAYSGYLAGSNGGACVTLFAPAKNLFLPSAASADGYRDARVNGFASGTSWSAPIVAGFAARIMQNNPSITPVQMRAALLNNSVSELEAASLSPRDYTGALIPNTPNKFLRLSDVNITINPSSSPAAPGGPTHLSVAAGGTAALSYQWYEVDGSFDYATYQHGTVPCPNAAGCNAVAIAGQIGSGFDAPVSSTTKAYYARVSNTCGSADSDIAVVVPRPSTPGNVNATANGGVVVVSWASASGAEKYRVERKIAGQPWTLAGDITAPTLNFAETPVAPEGMILYRVTSLAGTAYLQPGNLAASLPSAVDFANIAGYTDDPIAMGVTEIQAQHVIELRRLVNALCHTVDAPDEYQPVDLDAGSLANTGIFASDLTSLMSHINNIRGNALIAATPAGFVETPATDLEVKAQHLQSLRDALR